MCNEYTYTYNGNVHGVCWCEVGGNGRQGACVLLFASCCLSGENSRKTRVTPHLREEERRDKVRQDTTKRRRNAKV